jgi:hypothetical protein
VCADRRRGRKRDRADRATVSTTLSKLANSGEIAKAERGYRLPQSADAPDLGQGAATAANE